MPYIVHVLPRSEWEIFKQQGEYRPDSLAEQGFVHCSKLGQITVVADYHHADDDELVLLLLNESEIGAPIRYETDGEGGRSAFPHVYGPLTLESVVESYRFERDEPGFRLPEALLNDRFAASEPE